METLDHLIVAHEEQLIDENELMDLRNDINECLAILNGYIKYLQNSKTRSLSAKRTQMSDNNPILPGKPKSH